MARQKGVLTIDGTVNGLTFYKLGGKDVVRTIDEIRGKRILNDPRFVRVRENGKEFGGASKAGKLLRISVASMMRTASDLQVTPRVTKRMTEIMKTDSLNARGLRNVGTALLQPTAKAMLKRFEFNINAFMGAVLLNPYSVDTVTGKITITNLVPANDIKYPAGATHVTLKSAYAVVDFINSKSETQFSNDVNLAIDGTLTTVVLTPTAIPSITGTKIYFLRMEFFQEVNSVQYLLRNGLFNAMVVAEVG